MGEQDESGGMKNEGDKFGLPNTLLGIVSHETQRKYKDLELTNANLYKDNDILRQEVQDLLDQNQETKDFLNDKLAQRNREIGQLKDSVWKLEDNLNSLHEKRERDLAQLREESDETVASLRRKLRDLDTEMEKLIEFRSQREELLQRNTELQDQVETSEQQHIEKIQDIDRKNIHERQKIKNGMLERLRKTKEEIMKEVLSSVGMTVRRTIAENEHAVVELTYQSQQAEKLMKENEKLLRENRQLQINNSVQEEHINQLSKQAVLMKHTIRESQRKSASSTSIGEETSINIPSREEDEESVKTFGSDMTDQSKTLPSTPKEEKRKDSGRLGSRGSKSFSSSARVNSAQPNFQKKPSRVFDSVTKQAMTKAQTMINSVCSDVLAEASSDKTINRKEKAAIAQALQQVRAKIENENKRMAGDFGTKVRPVQDWSCDSMPFTEVGSTITEGKDSSAIQEERSSHGHSLNAESAELHIPENGTKPTPWHGVRNKQQSKFSSVISDPAGQTSSRSEGRPQSEPPSPLHSHPRHGYMLQGLKPVYVEKHEKTPKKHVVNVPSAEPAKTLQQTGKQLLASDTPKHGSQDIGKQPSKNDADIAKVSVTNSTKRKNIEVRTPDSGRASESVEPWKAL